jgi:UDP-glucose 4-epimerase
VSRLFEILAAAAGRSVEPQQLPLREGELQRSCMDPSRASEAIGWEPKIGVEAGLEQTYRELVAEFEAGP